VEGGSHTYVEFSDAVPVIGSVASGFSRKAVAVIGSVASGFSRKAVAVANLWIASRSLPAKEADATLTLSGAAW
jgi:hypothetical protein